MAELPESVRLLRLSPSLDAAFPGRARRLPESFALEFGDTLPLHAAAGESVFAAARRRTALHMIRDGGED